MKKLACLFGAVALSILPSEVRSASRNDTNRILSCTDGAIDSIKDNFKSSINNPPITDFSDQGRTTNRVTLGVASLSWPNRIQFSVNDINGNSFANVERSPIRRTLRIISRPSNDSERDTIANGMANNFKLCMEGRPMINYDDTATRYFDRLRPDTVRMRVQFN